MTDQPRAARAFAAVIGACVADAAALGLHWMYDPEHLRRIAGDRPEFRPPRAEDFEGVAAYFAQGQRRNGELSQYGEALVLALEAAAEPGPFQARSFQDRFRQHFGPGGDFRGYIDHPTRQFLSAITAGEEEARAAVDAPKDAINKAAQLVRRRSGPALEEALSGVDAAVAAAARALDKAWPDKSGGDDTQVPCLASPAPLAARFPAGQELEDAVAAATAVTHDNPVAQACNRAVTRSLAALIAGDDEPYAAFDGDFPEELAAPIARARGMKDGDLSGLEPAAKDFGRACPLRQALPLSLWILQRSGSFVEACRANIHAGGDNCGRALFLGAAAGATFGLGGPKGIPLSWFARLERGAEIARLLEAPPLG